MIKCPGLTDFIFLKKVFSPWPKKPLKKKVTRKPLKKEVTRKPFRKEEQRIENQVTKKPLKKECNIK